MDSNPLQSSPQGQLVLPDLGSIGQPNPVESGLPGENPNLYELIFELMARGSISAQIPECLLSLQSALNPVVLYTEGRVVKAYKGSHAFNKFFELVDLKVAALNQKEKDAIVPHYWVLGRDNSRFLGVNKDSAISQWRNLGENQMLISRLIQSSGSHPVVFRLKYENKKLTGFKVKNSPTASQHRETHQMKAVQLKLTSIYQHSPVDYKYAGKLLKDSFSPYMPFPSTLIDRLGSSGTPGRLKPINSELNFNRRIIPNTTRNSDCEPSPRIQSYLSSASTSDTMVLPMLSIPVELQNTISEFISSIERSSRSTEVQELILDCIEEFSGLFYITTCHKFQLRKMSPEEKASKDLRSRFRKMSDREGSSRVRLAPIEITRSELDLIRKDLQSTDRSAIPTPKIGGGLPPPEENCENQVVHAHSSSELEMKIHSHLCSVEEKYDNLIGRARGVRRVTKNLLADLGVSYGHVFDSFLDTVFQKIAENDRFRAVFLRKNREFEELKLGFVKVLRGDLSVKFRKSIKQICVNLGLSQTMLRNIIALAQEESGLLGASAEFQGLIGERLVEFFGNLV